MFIVREIGLDYFIRFNAFWLFLLFEDQYFTFFLFSVLPWLMLFLNVITSTPHWDQLHTLCTFYIENHWTVRWCVSFTLLNLLINFLQWVLLLQDLIINIFLLLSNQTNFINHIFYLVFIVSGVYLYLLSVVLISLLRTNNSLNYLIIHCSLAWRHLRNYFGLEVSDDTIKVFLWYVSGDRK